MTVEQIAAVDELTMLDFDEVHHGDCVGADHDMHRIAEANGQRIVVHPPSDNRLRAWCKGEIILSPRPYLDRNRDIVGACTTLLATPAEMEEQDKGGTWYTVRFARRRGVPVIVVWPDGSVAEESAA
jgi:hypothetical protein